MSGSLFTTYDMAANQAEQELRDYLAEIGWNIRQSGMRLLDKVPRALRILEKWCWKTSWIPVPPYIQAPSHLCGRVRIGYAIVWWIKDHQATSCMARLLTKMNWDLQTCKDSIDHMDMEDARTNYSRLPRWSLLENSRMVTVWGHDTYRRTLRTSCVSLEELSRKWRASINTTRQILKARTQMGICRAVHPYNPLLSYRSLLFEILAPEHDKISILCDKISIGEMDVRINGIDHSIGNWSMCDEPHNRYYSMAVWSIRDGIVHLGSILTSVKLWSPWLAQLLSISPQPVRTHPYKTCRVRIRIKSIHG